MVRGVAREIILEAAAVDLEGVAVADSTEEEEVAVRPLVDVGVGRILMVSSLKSLRKNVMCL